MVWVQLLEAVRANTMSEIGLRMIPNVHFNLLPVPLVVTYVFTGSTDWQQTAKSFHLVESLFKFENQLLLPFA
jgi:hypothetical protein